MTSSKHIFIGLLSLLFCFSTQLSAQNESTTDQPVERLNDELNLIADRAKISLEKIALDSMMCRLGFGSESEIEDLYAENWNTTYVKSYADVVIPDSFKIYTGNFVMPFENRVTSKYGPRGRRMHYGTDIKVQIGDTIVAAFDGKVRIVRNQGRRVGYGNFVVIRHPNGLETVYAHLSKFLVDQDQEVKAGEPIGLGGNTGRSFGSHLHLEFRFLGQPINPEHIVDFGECCARDDFYVFRKSTSSRTGGMFTTSSGDGKMKFYKVRSGDSLGRIASRHGLTISELCRLNNIKSTATIHPNQNLRVN